MSRRRLDYFLPKTFLLFRKYNTGVKTLFCKKKLYFFSCRKTTAIIAATFVSNALFFFIPTEGQDWICFFRMQSYSVRFESVAISRKGFEKANFTKIMNLMTVGKKKKHRTQQFITMMTFFRNKGTFVQFVESR